MLRDHVPRPAAPLARIQLTFWLVFFGLGSCLSKEPATAGLSEQTSTAVQSAVEPAPSEVQPDSSVAAPSEVQPTAPTPANYELTDGVAVMWGGLTNRCLAAAGASIVSGNYVTLADCDGSLSQQWQLTRGGFVLGNSLCMTGGGIGAAITLQACSPALSDANQRFLAFNDFFVSKAMYANASNALFAEKNSSTGVTQLIHRSKTNSADAKSNSPVITSTPRSRGFNIWPQADPTMCLQLTASAIGVGACSSRDANQRWTFEGGFLMSIANSNVLVAPPSSGTQLVLKPTSAASNLSNGFWLADQGDLPGNYPPSGSSQFSNIFYDPKTKLVTYPSNTTQSFWQLGGTGTP